MSGESESKREEEKGKCNNMGYDERGRRDGTGPYRDSYRRRVEGKSYGRRRERGEKCPHER